MQALRMIQDVAADGCLHVRVPVQMGTRFEVIVLPLDDAEPAVSHGYMKLQEESGFVQSVLAAAEEDVWNDL